VRLDTGILLMSFEFLCFLSFTGGAVSNAPRFRASLPKQYSGTHSLINFPFLIMIKNLLIRTISRVLLTLNRCYIWWVAENYYRLRDFSAREHTRFIRFFARF